MSGPARRPEPSWPTVIATTIRLWVERHPVMGTRVPRGRRGLLVIAVAIALGAGVAGVFAGRAVTSSRPAAAPGTGSRAAAASSPSAAAGPSGSAGPAGPSAALGDSVATRDQAAKWIAAQVAGSAIVACDPAMCAALQAAGIGPARLLALGTAAGDPLGSDVVAATPALRSQFGARLGRVYAPAVIASFGSGAGRIDVRAIAPSGAAAYQAALAADHRARVAAGRQLLRNSRITVTAAARAALLAGEVDPRVLMTLAALANAEPVRVLALGDSSPGAGPAVPLRGVTIAPAGSGRQARAGRAAMLSFLGAQRPPFLPLRTSLAGPSALDVEYAAPSPLGLLGGQ